MHITLDLIQRTRIGLIVNNLRKSIADEDVGALSKTLIKSWKKLLDQKDHSSSQKDNNGNNHNHNGAGSGDSSSINTNRNTALEANSNSNDSSQGNNWFYIILIIN